MRRLGAGRLLYATAMFGTAAVDPRTGRAFHDTVGMVEAVPGLDEAERTWMFSGYARRIYSRARWPAQGQAPGPST